MIKKFSRIAALGTILVAGLTNISLAVEWKWNGYFGALYSDNDKQNTKAHENDGAFDAFALSLIPQIKLNDRASVRGQIFFEHGPFFDVTTTGAALDPRSSGEIVLTDAYFNYSVYDYLNIRIGKFFTPFGIYNTQYYALPTFTTMKIPGADTVYKKGKIGSDTVYSDALFYSRFSQGLWIYGNQTIQELNLAYDLYLTNGRTYPGHTDDNSSKGVGGKLTVGLPLASVGFEKSDLSYSLFTDESKNPGNASAFEKQNSSLVSADLIWKAVGLKMEYVTGKFGSRKSNAYYVLADYTFMEKITPFVGYSYLEPDKNVSDDQDKITTLGINYQIIPWLTTIKFQVDMTDREKADAGGVKNDFNTYQVGVAAAF